MNNRIGIGFMIVVVELLYQIYRVSAKLPVDYLGVHQAYDGFMHDAREWYKDASGKE